jgi:hypothetical protein
VAALYIDPRGPYPRMDGVDCWDERRDARLYAGPWPVIAHPPCGPWGRLKFLCTKQDAELGPLAVEQVRIFGGVLEHPQDSTLWRKCRLPRPGELPDEWGGRTFYVEQVAWGHPCAKPTWLYCVGVDVAHVLRTLRYGGAPTHRITNGPRGVQLPKLPSGRTHLSPPAFAEWLVSLARSVDMKERAA